MTLAQCKIPAILIVLDVILKPSSLNQVQCLMTDQPNHENRQSKVTSPRTIFINRVGQFANWDTHRAIVFNLPSLRPTGQREAGGVIITRGLAPICQCI